MCVIKHLHCIYELGVRSYVFYISSAAGSIRSPCDSALFDTFMHVYVRTTYLTVHLILRSFGVNSTKRIRVASRSLHAYTHVLRTVCPILRSLGVKAHTSSHLPLATQPASSALTQHIVRRIEALSSRGDQAYRRRNTYNMIHRPLRELHFP